jgi:Asp-tRNA(Asn)/Glu-tRNA(Gln) amidotransferase A subunit family amidase
MQGGSVTSALSKDPSYKLRAITRNLSSEAAKKLEAHGIEVVEGDLKDLASLKAAFKAAILPSLSLLNMQLTIWRQGRACGLTNTNFWETVESQALPRQGKLLTWSMVRTSQIRQLKHQR